MSIRESYVNEGFWVNAIMLVFVLCLFLFSVGFTLWSFYSMEKNTQKKRRKTGLQSAFPLINIFHSIFSTLLLFTIVVEVYIGSMFFINTLIGALKAI